MYRYWDGTQWTSALSPTPNPLNPDAPAASSAGAGQSPWTGQAGSALGQGGAQPFTMRQAPPNPYAGASGYGPGPRQTAPRASGMKAAGWWLLVLLVLAGLIFGGTKLMGTIGLNPFEPPAPSNPTMNPCPPEPITFPTTPKHPADGRVHGGKLSYPMLSSPWEAPEYDNRLPFATDVSVQNVLVEPNYDGKYSWVASVLVAELIAGDGFFSPKEAVDLVAKCAMKSFYSDATVGRNDLVSKAVTLSGHEGWLIETHLTFDIKGLKVKGETAIFMVVRINDTSSSLYYASIPDSVPEYLVTARQVQSQLTIDP